MPTTWIQGFQKLCHVHLKEECIRPPLPAVVQAHCRAGIGKVIASVCAETGVNAKLGYSSPADLAQHYPAFFWTKVEPYIRDARRHLEQTVEGRQWLAQLYSNVFAMEHNQQGMGPHLSP